MLTIRTQKAIDILHKIAYHQSQSCSKRKGADLCTPECLLILEQLRLAGFIRLLPDMEAKSCASYVLCLALSDISLYQLLLAIGESVNLVDTLNNEERIYKHYHYGNGALKLGVVNQTLSTLLSDIHVIDF
ncbi:hypothetical protein [uncultured Bacteroides sp.]|uniref:hypothetical protein n=1 Tax=uncultured Bacteroides sp. TaxID=162156 RepID=UPI0025DE12C6|nr:hypothetical protein [uncultured Bacteroides sp.]